MLGRRSKDLLSRIEESALSSNHSLADALRLCVALGGQAGSVALRDWAARELRGYESVDEVPSYRQIVAAICIDGMTPGYQVSGQTISVEALPEIARGHYSEDLQVRQGIAEVERFAQRDDVKLGLPGGAELALLMTSELGYGHIVHRIYWHPSPVAFASIVDQVRNRLVELVAEIRAGVEEDGALPTADVANQAVNVVVNGARNRVSVRAAVAGEDATMPSPTEEEGGWIGALVAAGSIATIAGVVLAVLQFVL